MQPQQLGPEPVLPFWSGVVDRGLRLAAYGAVFGSVAGTVILAGTLLALLITNPRDALPILMGEEGPLPPVAAVILAGPGSGALGGALALALIGALGGRPPSGTPNLRRGILQVVGFFVGGWVGFGLASLPGMWVNSGLSGTVGATVSYSLGFLVCQVAIVGLGTAIAFGLGRTADADSEVAAPSIASFLILTCLLSFIAMTGIFHGQGPILWLVIMALLIAAGCAAATVSSWGLGRMATQHPWVITSGLVAILGFCATVVLSTEGEGLSRWVANLGSGPGTCGGCDYGPDRVRDLEGVVASWGGAAPSADQVESIRADAQGLMNANRSDDSERCLDLLLRLPRTGAPPAPPDYLVNQETARKYQRDYAAWLNVPVEFVNSDGMAFILIPPGTFLMGSPDGEPGHNAGGYDETRHPVTLTRAFYLGKHEVTVEQFRRFVTATSHVTDGERRGGGNAHDARAEWKHRPGTHWLSPGFAGPYQQLDTHPVVHVSHNDATAYCRWRQTRSPGGGGLKYVLPTEAQWEWACRAGSGSRYWWGSVEDTSGKVANVGDRSLKGVHPEWPRPVMAMDDGHPFVAPVGSYRANGFGLHDMLGNVWEFCSTRYGPYPKDAVTDPEGGDPKRGFAVRGGGWSNVAADVRCASRNADPPDFCHSNLGFRVAIVWAD